MPNTPSAVVEAVSEGLNGQARLIGSRGNGSRRPPAQGLSARQRIASLRDEPAGLAAEVATAGRVTPRGCSGDAARRRAG